MRPARSKSLKPKGDKEHRAPNKSFHPRDKETRQPTMEQDVFQLKGMMQRMMITLNSSAINEWQHEIYKYQRYFERETHKEIREFLGSELSSYKTQRSLMKKEQDYWLQKEKEWFNESKRMHRAIALHGKQESCASIDTILGKAKPRGVVRKS